MAWWIEHMSGRATFSPYDSVSGILGTADPIPLENAYFLLLLSTTDGYKVRIAEAQRGSTSSIPDNVMFRFGPRGDIRNLSLSLFLSD